MVGEFVGLAFLGGEAEAAVSDGGVNAAVGSKGEAIEVVSREGDAHAHAILDDGACV